MKQLWSVFFIFQTSIAYSFDLPKVLPLERLELGSGFATAQSIHFYHKEDILFCELATFNYWKSSPMDKVETVKADIKLSHSDAGDTEFLSGDGIHIEKNNATPYLKVDVNILGKEYNLYFICNNKYNYCRLNP